MPGTTWPGWKATCSVSAEEVVRVAVEHQPADLVHRHQLLRDQLGRVQQVEAERMLLVLGHQLHAQLPLGKVAALDGLPQVAAQEVRLAPGDLLRLVPQQGVRAQPRPPVELDEVRLAAGIDEAEGVHAEALHHAQAARQPPVAHGPQQRVGGLGHERGEIPEGVVRARGLRHAVVRLGLDGVHQVGELHRVLHEEHRQAGADQVVVALLRVELDGEAAHVAHRVGRALRARHVGEAHEHRRALRRVLQEVGAGELRHRFVDLEVAVRAGAAREHDALGNALLAEVRKLLAQDEVFQQGRSARPGGERMVVVRDLHALVGGELRHRVDGAGRQLLLLGRRTLARRFRAPSGSRFVVWRHPRFFRARECHRARPDGTGRRRRFSRPWCRSRRSAPAR